MVKKSFLRIFSISSSFAGVRIMYNNLKQNDYAKKHTTLIGRKAILHILTTGISLVLIPIFVAEFIKSFAMVQILLIVAYGALITSLGTLIVTNLPMSINLIVKQLKLNKRFIGYFNLVLFFIFIITTIVLFIIIL